MHDYAADGKGLFLRGNQQGGKAHTGLVIIGIKILGLLVQDSHQGEGPLFADTAGGLQVQGQGIADFRLFHAQADQGT